jgi:2,3-bisphosphoglycerate-independent phosphoglycerate mutase
MKHIIIIGDGMADYPLPDYAHRTPLEVAQTPAMDAVAARGVVGLFCPIPDGMAPGSDIGNLSMFGYNPREAFRGRAPIEAANQGIVLADNEVCFRCNLVTLENSVMKDFTAGHISTEEARDIIRSLNDPLSKEFPVSFHPGVSYRHLMVFPADDTEALEALVALECTPPHNITDQPYASHLPHGELQDVVRRMMARSQEILPDHPVNAQRRAQGLLPATSIWLWGQGKAPHMESYASKFGISGAVISAVDLVKGMGVCAGLEVINLPGATGWIDTDYAGKAAAGLDALDRHDFVVIHVEAPDETAHQGRADLKIQSIEDLDRQVVAPCLHYVEQHPDTRLLVAPDHFTLISTKTHAGGPVPFAMCGAGIAPSGAPGYSEAHGDDSGILVEEGHTLVQRMLREPSLKF